MRLLLEGALGLDGQFGGHDCDCEKSQITGRVVEMALNFSEVEALTFTFRGSELVGLECPDIFQKTS